MIDPTNANGDAVPDGWATLYGLTNASDDPGKDGLNNKREFDLGSNPLVADSDEDGFYDLEEVSWRTDLCGPETPPYHRQPRLQVSGLGALSFNVATDLTTSPKRTLRLFNGGSDELQWTVNATEPWIEINPPGGTGPGPVEIDVNMQGMAPGLYTGVVEIHSSQVAEVNAATADSVNAVEQTVVDETVTIPVRVKVLPPKMEEVTTRQILMPIIKR